MFLLCRKEGKGERIFCICLDFPQEVLEQQSNNQNFHIPSHIEQMIAGPITTAGETPKKPNEWQPVETGKWGEQDRGGNYSSQSLPF